MDMDMGSAGEPSADIAVSKDVSTYKSIFSKDMSKHGTASHGNEIDFDIEKVHPASIRVSPSASAAGPKTLKEEVIIRLIKLFDIGYAGAFYFIVAMLVIQIFNYLGGEFHLEDEEQKPTGKLFFEVIVKIWLIAILAYIVRNLFELVPFPLEGVYGYQHLRVKEVTNSAIFFAFVVLFDARLQARVGILKERFRGNNVHLKKGEKKESNEHAKTPEMQSGLNKM